MPMPLDPSNPINNTVEEDRQAIEEAIDIIKDLLEMEHSTTENWNPEETNNTIDRARAFVDKFEE